MHIDKMDIRPTSADDPDAAPLLYELSKTLAAITGDSGANSFDPADVGVTGALFVIAYDGEQVAVGCGAYRPLHDGVAELKRMFALPGSKGVGSSILKFLEKAAAEYGYRELWLETRVVNERAVSFYQKHDYRRIPNFGKYVGRPEAICFAKRVSG